MKLFNRPVNLNGAELKEELLKSNIVVESIIDYSNGKIGFECADQEAAEIIVRKHNGKINSSEPTIVEKLAIVGLSLEELKTAVLS